MNTNVIDRVQLWSTKKIMIYCMDFGFRNMHYMYDLPDRKALELYENDYLKSTL